MGEETNLSISKFIVAILLGLIRFSVILIPLRVYNFINNDKSKTNLDEWLCDSKRRRFNIYISILHSFGAGVMLGTGLIHLVTSIHSATIKEYSGEMTSPCQFAQMLICGGFFMIYFIEEIGQWIITKVPQKPFITNKEYSNDSIICKSDTIISSISENMAQNQLETVKIRVANNSTPRIENEENVVIIDKRQFVRFFFCEVAVGSHAIFEGLAIGLQCKVANVIYLTIGMTLHSITSLLCLGFNLIIARTTKRNLFVHYVIHAISSPFAVLLGLVINAFIWNFRKEAEKINLFIEALSAGNILYITFFEILSKEKKKSTRKILRNVFLIAGFALMGFLEYFTFDRIEME